MNATATVEHWYRGRQRVLLGLAAASVLAAAAGASVALVSDGDGSRTPTILLHGDSRLPSTSLQDWATYADHVVVVTPTSEVPVAMGEGKGGGLGMRTVTSRVDSVVWSSASAAQKAPTSIELTMLGTRVSDGGEVVELAMAGVPRLEVGHTYLVALSYVPARCAPGDAPEPGHFEPLGEHALVPYDHNRIGEGEVEGSVRSSAQAQAAAKSSAVERTVADAFVGQGADAVTAGLGSTPPGERQVFSSPAPCP